MKYENWIAGNRLELLENGEEFFAAVFAAIEQARSEILLETFILFEDQVGLALHSVLVDAARRGVRVEVTVDGFGSPDLSATFLQRLSDAGVNLRVFDPPPRFARHLALLRRLHRKLIVIDGKLGFVGGINFAADHLSDYGPEAKQDYAARVRGPIVAAMHRMALKTLAHARRRDRRLADYRVDPPCEALNAPPPGDAEAVFVTRDNTEHRGDIERHYRLALKAARRDVLIANAYFLPGYRLMRTLQQTAERGVRVRLILQGQPDMRWVSIATRTLYRRLLRAGVEILEYRRRPMHAKVAVVDDEWATIGSCNLDPLSLTLNLEANLIVRDRDFNRQIRDKLEALARGDCANIEVDEFETRPPLRHRLLGHFVFALLRLIPNWAARLPRHEPRIVPADPARGTRGTRGTRAAHTAHTAHTAHAAHIAHAAHASRAARAPAPRERDHAWQRRIDHTALRGEHPE
ncbi:MAG: cardiolipin synthase ClsB [Burkholderiaceae bacterium]